jgi:formate hydrogenlyase subunit 5
VTIATISRAVSERWPESAQPRIDPRGSWCELDAAVADVPRICKWLFAEMRYGFLGLIVEEGSTAWQLRYAFYPDDGSGWVQVVAAQPLADQVFPSISAFVPAADWHEREAEDLFGISFEGHPRLGDFVLHDDRWHENVAPMRHAFDAAKPVPNREPNLDWQPRRIVEAEGAFAMPIGPKFSGVTEPVHFLLETVGEDVIRAYRRLFYKYRAVEKMAEGRSAEDALLLAERFAATTAFSHGLAYCQAVESIRGILVPERARALRVFLAELERLRHHAGAIREVCESTGLLVATSQAAILEEGLLRLCGALTGHRYLFGLNVPGGLSLDLEDARCREALERVREFSARLDLLEEMLRKSSSFLDRLEEVGVVRTEEARSHGLLGPVARASALASDLRKAQPYCGYDAYSFEVPSEQEGDGYARLRVLFEEARQSVSLMDQANAPGGPVLSIGGELRKGAALGWVEAPRGAAGHWLRLDEQGRVVRYRLLTPSFANWHGFHLAAERFAFQDFPIILATFGLSVAESDR